MPEWTRLPGGGWCEAPPGAKSNDAEPVCLSAGQAHGKYGAARGSSWELPRRTFVSAQSARPGYSSIDASEYHDADETLGAKLGVLAALLGRAKCCVVYAGAGLSTAAGIPDYASQSASASDAERLRSPMCAQPSLSHRVLVGMHRAGLVHRLVQQNHDGLPQKAGLPQQAVNEIHGSLYAPDNPVIPMSGCLRSDLLDDLLELEARADLVVAVGTSLAGMNADRLVHAAAARASRGAGLGVVIIGLQRTPADESSTLRLFAPCDTAFARLAPLLYGVAPLVPPARVPGNFFVPAVLAAASDPDARYLLSGLQYDAMGRRVADPTTAPTALDLRDGASLVIPSGVHAGAIGEVDGTDREGHPRCRFWLRLKPDKPFKAPMMLTLGSWWLQAAVDAAVESIPVVNAPRGDSAAACELRALCDAYCKSV